MIGQALHNVIDVIGQALHSRPTGNVSCTMARGYRADCGVCVPIKSSRPSEKGPREEIIGGIILTAILRLRTVCGSSQEIRP